MRLRVTGGERHDITQAVALVEGYAVETVLADKAYDVNSFIEWLEQRDIEIVIPPCKYRKQTRGYDEHHYGERHLVECCFNKIKRFRRIFTRYDKLLRNDSSFAYLGAIHVWLR